MKKLSFLSLLFMAKLSAAVYLEPTPQFKPYAEIATVYIEYDDQILLLHRQNNKSHGNQWGIPGGRVENNETPLQAAVRETKEETGIDISNRTIEPLKIAYVEHNEKIHIIYHAFRTQLQGDPGEVKINFSEHKGFTWVTPGDALKMDLMQDEDACIMKDYFSKI